MSLHVGIVGGSIAGCSAAILLRRAGHEVDVFERSHGGLVGRGGGIGTPGPVLDSLIGADILDSDFPHMMATSMPFVVRTPDALEFGYVPWEMPMNLAAFHWSSLWKQLRRRVPEERYHQGQEVTGAHAEDEGVLLTFADGNRRHFDLVIFADGYRSLGRRLLFPDTDLRYRGYMLWRGLLPESEDAAAGTLGATVPRIAFTSGAGNLVLYFVPGQDGSCTPGERLVNWASYIELPSDEVDDFMVDRSGVRRDGTVPPGQMRPEAERGLKDQMIDVLPALHARIIDATSDTYVQLIYTARVPAYAKGRMCLIGDAGSVAQPFTGSGVFKGYNNVSSLVDALSAHSDLDSALATWSNEQVRVADRLLGLGEQMERAFIWDPPDLAGADAASTETWWRESVSFPEDFTYSDDT